MTRFFIFVLWLNCSGSLLAQRSTALTSSQRGELLLIEKKMQRIGSQFLADTSQDVRIKGARDFVKLLIEAMKVENSFQYPFDSIPYLAKVVPEDSNFKIYTFQVYLKNFTFRHYGCIQLNRKNIKIIPLKDFSDTFPTTPQSTLTSNNWYGAVYYRILTKKINNKPVYFLFGFDQNDVLSDKKIIEPMWLEKDSIAKFGMPVFEKTQVDSFPEPPKKFMSEATRRPPPIITTKTFYRYILEYRKNSNVSLKYDRVKDIIVHDHTPPLDGKTKDIGFIKVPDGTYEGLKWTKDKWVWVDYVKLADEESNKVITPVPLKKQTQIPKEE